MKKLIITLALISWVPAAQAQGHDPGADRGNSAEGGGGSTRDGTPQIDSPALDHDEEIDEKLQTEQKRIRGIINRFRGSSFLFDQSITPETMSPQAQLSQVPSYQWWLSLRPRFYIKPYLSLRVRLDLTVEWLNGGSDTTYKRQAILGDFWTDLAYSIPKTFWGIQATVSARALFPTSLDSMAANTVMKVGPAVGLTRTFHTKIGEFEPSLGFYSLYNFVTSTTPSVQGSGYGCANIDLGPANCSQNPLGRLDGQVNFVAIMGIRYAPITKLSINANYIILDAWGYRPSSAIASDVEGGSQNVQASAIDTRFRQSSWFLASVDYDVRDWLTLSLGYYTLRPVRDADGKIGDPFYKDGGDTRVFLTTVFSLDGIANAVAKKRSSNKTYVKRQVNLQ